MIENLCIQSRQILNIYVWKLLNLIKKIAVVKADISAVNTI